MIRQLISICIPAFKRVEFLQRLLDSISIQTFRDFEVIVTDDSPGEEVRHLCRQYESRFLLRYFHNASPLGTPENWNAAIRKAEGEWIKLMHDDDWFSDAESLSEFANAIENSGGAHFLFSGYVNHFLDSNVSEPVSPSATRLKQLKLNPVTLFSSNVIGPPSVVMHRNDRATFYDPRVKWVVDIDFYIRILETQAFYYIDKQLISVGIGKEQVTADCFRKRQVEIPEAFHLFHKTGFRHLQHILVYDGWWRLIRNLEIRNMKDISGSGYTGPIPPPIRSMVKWQSRFPLRLLRFGPFSKALMFLNYIYNRKNIS